MEDGSRFYSQTGTRRFTQVFKIILHDVRLTYDITLFTWRRTAVLTTYSLCYVPSFSEDPDLKKLYLVDENNWKMKVYLIDLMMHPSCQWLNTVTSQLYRTEEPKMFSSVRMKRYMDRQLDISLPSTKPFLKTSSAPASTMQHLLPSALSITASSTSSWTWRA